MNLHEAIMYLLEDLVETYTYQRCAFEKFITDIQCSSMSQLILALELVIFDDARTTSFPRLYILLLVFHQLIKISLKSHVR